MRAVSLTYMMQFFPELLTVAVIHLLAAMAPGPDFVMISRNSIVYSRRIGLYSALGLMFGIMVHIAYSLAGIGLVIAHSVFLYTTIKWIGALYLIHLGIQSLRTSSTVQGSVEKATSTKNISAWSAVRMGFFTNVLNPKATIFFLALFSQVIDPSTPIYVQLVYGLEMSMMQFLWFGSLAYAFSTSHARNVFARAQGYIEKVMGSALILLGIKLAVTDSN